MAEGEGVHTTQVSTDVRHEGTTSFASEAFDDLDSDWGGLPADSARLGEPCASQSGLESVGPYRVQHQIGRGGRGEVFAGFDPRLERPVAIKRLAASWAIHAGAREELRREAKIAAKLDHPGIVRVYDIVSLDAADYLVCELVDGVTLDEMLRSLPQTRLPLPRALQIGLELIQAIRHAHERDIVHLDIKTANVLIAKDGVAKLADFGIAATVRGLVDAAANPGDGTLSGTYFAMSPEQTRGEATDARSDLFSFGVLLYEMISGVAPFFASDPLTCLRRVRESQPLPLAELDSAVPQPVSRLVDRLLAKRRQGRPESAGEVETALSAALAAQSGRSGDSGPGSAQDRQAAVVCFRHAAADATARPGSEARPEQELVFLDSLYDTVARAGGSVLASAGGLAVFCIGYPVAHDNNCEVALRLVLELSGQLVGTATDDSQPSFAAGVDCGLVRIRTRADRVLATGTVVNEAIAMASEAPDGASLVSLSAQSLTRRFFRFVPAEDASRAAAGRTPIYRLTDVISPEVGIEQVSATPLRGRTEELRKLDEAWQHALGCNVTTRLVLGTGGVGKSRLIHTFRAASTPAADFVLGAYGTPRDQSSPFEPLLRLLRRWFDLATDDAGRRRAQLAEGLAKARLPQDEYAPVLEHLLGAAESDDPLRRMPADARRRLVVETLAKLFGDLAEHASLILIVEDLHWLDRSSLATLRRLSHRPRPLRLLLILTARPEFVASWPDAAKFEEIRVEPLDSMDSLRLIESIAGESALPSGVMRRLVELGDGIPLMLEELTRATLASVRNGVEATELRHPTSLTDSITRKLEELGPAADIIRVAAAIGREVPLKLLAAVLEADKEEFRARVHKLEAAGLVYLRKTERTWSSVFTHALVRDAVYESIPAHKIAGIHARVVKVLEARYPAQVEQNPGLFAHHYASAGATARALDLFELAGRRAAEASAHSEACTHFQTALSLLQSQRPHDPMRERRLRQSLGPSLMAIEGWSSSAVEDNLRRTQALGRDHGQPSELRELMGLWAHGVVTHELSTVHAALAAMATLPPSPEQRFAALSANGVTAFYRGDFATARQFLEQVAAMLRGAFHRTLDFVDTLEPATVRAWGSEFAVAGLVHLTWIEAICDRREIAENVHTQTELLLRTLSSDSDFLELRHAHQMRVYFGLTWRDAEYYAYSQFRNGRGPLHDLFEVAGARFPFHRNVARIGDARARVTPGDREALRELADAYRNVKSLSKKPVAHIFFSTIIADGFLQANDPEGAEPYLREALDAADSDFCRFYAPEAYRVSAERHLLLGDMAGARDAIRRGHGALSILDAGTDIPAALFAARLAETDTRIDS